MQSNVLQASSLGAFKTYLPMKPLIPLVLGILLLLLPEGIAAPTVSTNQHAANPRAVAKTWYIAERNALAQMPQGGSYSTSQEAFENLIDSFQWNANQSQILISPTKAQPSFCSSACYLLLLASLKEWEKSTQQQFPAKVWQALLPYPKQADGVGIWGRANANGPGFAKLIHELGAGFNFEDFKQARPGDFMKIFWSEHIGAKEFGHLTLFLSQQIEEGIPTISFWSSNQPDGYGKKTIPQSQIIRVIFTRITKPEAFMRVTQLPETDEWLQSLLKTAVSPVEVRKQCGIAAP